MTLPKPYYQDDAVTLYNTDCRELLPLLGKFDLLLTDPPYGINWRGSNASTVKWEPIQNDENTNIVAELFKWVLNFEDCVIFGANCFPHLLPHRGRWLCWDKRLTVDADKMLGSPFELAWESRVSGFDVMERVLHGGVVNADGGKRMHPTQKPVTLMRRVIARYKKSQTIFDPFAGSGTTLVAAKLEGRKAVGIEISERYCEIAAKRLSQQLLF